MAKTKLKPQPTGTLELGDLVFQELAEVIRTYDYGDSKSIVVDEPMYLNVKRKRKLYSAETEDSHRIICRDGSAVYIPAGWRAITWVPLEGYAPFWEEQKNIQGDK